MEPVEVRAVGPEEAEDCTAEATSVATASLIVVRMSLIKKVAGVGSGGMAHGPDSERVPTLVQDEEMDLLDIVGL